MSKEQADIQKQLIYLLLRNKDILSQWSDMEIDIECFDPKFKILLTAIRDASEKGVLLTRQSFWSFLRKFNNIDEEEQDIIFDECKVSRVDPNDFPYLIEQIQENYLKKYSLISLKKFENNIKKKGYLPSIRDLISELEDVKTFSVTDKKVIYKDITSFSEEKLDYIDKIRSGEIKEPPRILCNIPEIDETMMTGFLEGTLTLFCGDVGGYKSACMLNIALNIWKNGYNVLFVPIEMPYQKMYNRALARESRVATEKIADPTKLTDEERNQIEETQKEWKEYKNAYFYILEMPDETTVGNIKRQIEKFIDVFRPKMVVIDYIDNLEPERKHERRDLEIRDMVIKMSKMGQRFGFSVVSAAQLGKKTLEKIRGKPFGNFNSEDIRGSHTAAMYADNIYALIPNTTQPTALLDIYVIKARDGKKTFSGDRIKSSLLITPEIGLIQSEEDFNISDENETLEQIWSGEEDSELDSDFDFEI